MTSAGWYPDPAGQPNTYRYWNGQSWSQETTGNPASPPPGAPPYQPYGQPPATQQPAPQQPAAPQQYAGYGQAGYGQAGYGQGAYGAPPPPPGGSGGAGKVIALVVAGVVLLAALGAGAFFLVRSLDGDGDGDDSASDDTSASTGPTESETGATEDTPSPTESGGPTDDQSSGGIDVGPTRAQCSGGAPDPGRLQASANTLTGGGLTIPSLADQGYTVDASVALAFTWADDYQVSFKAIESAGESWIANYGVGGLAKANGFESPQQAAEVVLQCMTSSDMYQGYSGTTDLEVGPVTVDGHDAYSILTEVRVDNPDVQAEGDVTHVVVVDTGDPDSFGLYISVVPIGDQAEINQQARVFDQIDVQ